MMFDRCKAQADSTLLSDYHSAKTVQEQVIVLERYLADMQKCQIEFGKADTSCKLKTNSPTEPAVTPEVFEAKMLEIELLRPLVNKFSETHKSDLADLEGGKGEWLKKLKLQEKYAPFMCDALTVLADVGLVDEATFLNYVEQFLKEEKETRKKLEEEWKERSRKFWGFKNESEVMSTIVTENLRKVLKNNG